MKKEEIFEECQLMLSPRLRKSKSVTDDMLLGQIEELDKSLIGMTFSDKNCPPKAFFVGAAIENIMAREIYDRLYNHTLSNGAHSTNENQVVSLCDWVNQNLRQKADNKAM